MNDLITLESALKSELQAIGDKLDEFRQRLEALEAAASVQPPADGDPDKIAAQILKQAENSHKKAAEREGLAQAIAHFETLQSQKTEALNELQAQIQTVKYQAIYDECLQAAREQAVEINELSELLQAKLEKFWADLSPGRIANLALGVERLGMSDLFVSWSKWASNLPYVEFREENPDLLSRIAVRNRLIKRDQGFGTPQPQPEQGSDQGDEASSEVAA